MQPAKNRIRRRVCEVFGDDLKYKSEMETVEYIPITARTCCREKAGRQGL